MPRPEPEIASLRAALRAAEEHLAEERRMFFSGPVVVFKWKNEPGWPVEYVSANAEQVFGRIAAEFLRGEVSYASLIVPEDLERVSREVADASESGATQFAHQPYRFLRKNGEIGWLSDHTTILRRPDGTVEHYLGYVIDVTERMRAEAESAELRAQVLHSQKLESLGLLAGGVAHDFNNLLTGILGYADLVEAAASPAAVAEHVAMIRASASRAADLCQQMLAYSGRGKFEVGAHDLNALALEMAQLLEVGISKRIALRYELAPDLPAIEADATQIRQLLMNLITNAAEAIGDAAGTITLTTGAVDDRVFARVSDDGCGMDAETRERMFDPFFTTKVEGRGLGMAAAHGILRGHGGTLDVDSTPGEGTTIEVRLPASSRLAEARSAPPAFDSAWRGSGTALVIDDEEIIRLLATRVLERAGFRVEVAEDGQRGVALFGRIQHDVSVVFLDLTMPGKSGVDTLRELLAMRPDVPIVMSSGYNREEVAELLDPGVHPPFLKKPFLPRDLVVAVRQAMEGRVPAPPC
jgi:PAS domain S-box-containing protein